MKLTRPGTAMVLETTQFESKLTALRGELDATETERGRLSTLGGDIMFDVGRSELRAGANRRGRIEGQPKRRVEVLLACDATAVLLP